MLSDSQKAAIIKLKETAKFITDLPLAQFEEILDLPGLLNAIHKANDPEQGNADNEEDFVKYKGKKSYKLWCLLEDYSSDVYNLEEVPSKPLKYITDKFQKHIKLTEKQAQIICEFFIFIKSVKPETTDSHTCNINDDLKAKIDFSSNHLELRQHSMSKSKSPIMHSSQNVIVSSGSNSLSELISKTLLSSAVAVEKEINAVFVRLSKELILEFKWDSADQERLLSVWGRVSGDQAKIIQAGLDKEAQRKKNEETKLKKRAELSKAPTCGYKYGSKSKNANTLCNEPCQDGTIYKDPKTGIEYCLCNKHKKSRAAKQACEWVYDESAPKKKGQDCGCRCVKVKYQPGVDGKKGKWIKIEGEPETFTRDGVSKNGVSFVGKHLCLKHIAHAHDALDKVDHQCIHRGSKGEKKQCESLSIRNDDGTWTNHCNKHTKDSKKKSKKEKSQRKALKSGNNKKKSEKAEKKSEDDMKEENNEDNQEDEKSESKEDKKSNKKSKIKSSKSKKSKKSKASDDENDSDNENDSDDEKSEEIKDETKDVKEPLKSSAKISKSKKSTESEVSNKDSDSKEEKLIVKENFNIKPSRALNWVIRKGHADDDSNDTYIFIDMNSGLVAYNSDDAASQEIDEKTLVVIGTWDNETQDYFEPTKESIKYAMKLGLECQGEQDD